MFSTLSSFLPAALRDTQRTPSFSQDNDEGEQQRDEVQTQAPHEGTEPSEQRQASPQRRRRERGRRNASEMLVIVRPPPSKSNHPLNLQVQLVPPHSKGVFPRQSIDFESGQPSSLYRIPSNRSQESSTTSGSTSSFASGISGATTATSSTSSTRRAIVPLYNLQAHNVLPNVIVDAGTDAKVAKFQKRGIEIVDLALLEPIEVWPDPNAAIMPVVVAASTLAVPIVGPEASTSTLGRLSVDEMGFAQLNTRAGAISGRSVAAFLATPVDPTGSRPATPDGQILNTAGSSSASLSSVSHEPQQFGDARLTTSPEPQGTPLSAVFSPTSAKRNIFGKIFKKGGKDAAQPVGSPMNSPQAQYAENANVSYDQSGTPTQMQHTITPTPHQHYQLGSKGQIPTSSSTKRASGGRGSWLLGSPSALKTPSQTVSSPLSATFSSLGLKRRTLASTGPAVEGAALVVNLNNEAENGASRPSQPAGLNPAQVLTTVSQSGQAQPQPQLSQPVLGVQPTLCVVPASVLGSSRASRRLKLRTSDDDASRSAERSYVDDNTNGGSNFKEREEKRGKIIRRAYMYVWLARKWMKRRPHPPHTPHHKQENGRFGLRLPLGGPNKGLGVDATWKHPHKDRELGVEEIVEVRFEWRRAPTSVSPKKKQGGASEGAGAAPGADREARRLNRQSWHSGEGRKRSLSLRGEDGERAVKGEEDRQDDVGARRGRKPSASSVSSARAAAKRWSLLSHQSVSTGGASEDGEKGVDSGEESDPEDSETPWVCTLKVRRTNLAAAKEAGVSVAPSNPSSTRQTRSKERGKGSNADDDEEMAKDQESSQQEVLRIKVGMLSPTPHHPKVVAMLKVPFPLPDVQIERLEVVKRRGLVPSPHSGTASDEKMIDYYGLTLTAEEIKDIVCSTSLWLIVRENIGGVGKVQRKGDGWMIRP